MFYGEHLNAEEIAQTCPCGRTAIIEVFDGRKRSHGWFCRRHAVRKHDELRRREKQKKIARAIVVKRGGTL